MPPLYVWPLRPRDSSVLMHQMRGRSFEPAIALGIARRCRWGMPQVLLCVPFFRGKPFPTTFWLSCPFLAMMCSQMEALGGIKQLEEFMKDNADDRDWLDFNVEHALLRLALLSRGERRYLQKARKGMMDRLRLSGVGGIARRSGFNVKCLHLQVASWLALRKHPAESWLKERLSTVECEEPDRFCIN